MNMAFTHQDDFKTFEVKRTVGGNLSFFPRVDGSGSVGITSATANVYRNTLSISSPTVSITPTIIQDVTASRLSVPIEAGLDYHHDYRVEVEWTVSGSGYVGYTTIPFEVCYQPWGDSTVSYDDMVAMSELSGQLTTIADERGKTVREVASQFAASAHADLDLWIRNKASDDGQLRARAILDRSRLHNIEVKLAIAKVWGFYMGGDPNTDQATLLHDRWLNDARSSFAALGDMRYDTNDDGTPDATVSGIGRNIRMRRVR